MTKMLDEITHSFTLRKPMTTKTAVKTIIGKVVGKNNIKPRKEIIYMTWAYDGDGWYDLCTYSTLKEAQRSVRLEDFPTRIVKFTLE